MSKVNPVSTSASASSLDHVSKKTRRKVSRVRLPTPPPDPNINPEDDQTKARHLGEKEAEFLEYLESLQRNHPHPALSRSTSVFAPAIATEDAFDHLDKLYKLMEQMLTLREQNAILHRRIMDLERLRNMQDLRSARQLDTAEKLEDVPVYDPESLFEENLLYNILNGVKKEYKQKTPVRFRQSILRKSQRSRLDQNDQGYERRRVSVATSSLDKPSKVSKWTKVKAAFKWEKASPTVSDAKSQDSGLGGMQPVNYEVARYLRVPSTSEELGTSPADSGAAEVSTPGSISSASSTEDIHGHVRRRTQDDTSDEEQIFSFDYIPINKDEPSTSSAGKSGKSHRTPWAKMKDIIHTQTRNSFKKKHRLSTKSDDFKMDGSMCSDNEDVFENEDNKSPILIIQSPEDISKENDALSLEHSIPVDIIARYRVINDESNVQGRLSNWSKVKKAFLSSPSISRNESSSPVSNPEFPAIRREANPTKESDEKLHAEIQKNYLQLQKKLSQEFQEKLQEWERSKLNSPCTSVSSTTQMNQMQDDNKDLAFKKKMEEWEKIRGQPKHNMQLQSEENLPPEFRKKLQEWKKIKKSSMKEESKKKNTEWSRWRSVSAHRSEHGLENQPLSDDFIKKYESWKQIKSAGTTPTEEIDSRGSFKGNKSPSPRLSRKDCSTRESKRIKYQTEKELLWIEKELNKIERDKQRLERDRQKFLERDERLPKLRRSVIGGNKKEILVNTPSGLYRFEGISRKFTRKLYEWEKARGIRPEESTFALLKSSCIPQIRSAKSNLSSAPLERSKSADSIMNPDLNPVCPLLSQQPSSLSLNDMANLEKDMMLESSSVPDIIRSSENVDSEEPEAIIVEVEDVVEETASFLENFMEKHTPVYLKQENRYMCEGETRAAPTIRRSESTRAQANYNLIEDIIITLKGLAENEEDIERIENSKLNSDSIIIINSDDDGDVQTLKTKQAQQRDLSSILIEKLILLQEANTTVASDITRDGSNFTISRLSDVLETIQDLSSAIFNIAEAIDRNIFKRNKNQMESDIIHSTTQTYPQIAEHLAILNYKILDLRRNLSYICAASDMSISSWKKKQERPLLRKIPSVERKRANFRKTRSKDSQEESIRKMCSKDESDDSDLETAKNNSPSLTRQVEQGAIKKRIRYRQKGMQSKTLDETDDEDEEFMERKPKPRRVRSQNSTESNISVIERDVKREEESKEEIKVDPCVVEKVLVPTKTTNFLNFEENKQSETQDSPVTVFVKTTRKLFTPIAASSTSQETSDTGTPNTPDCVKQEETAQKLPPAHASPIPQRKLIKEISPNIRLMMVKYNQKLTEEGGAPKSAGSSGSASPVAWRSPVLERRVKAQTERYQQELQKMSPLLGGRREVQKSASMGVVVSGNKQVTVHGRTEASPESSPKVCRGILKSSSTGVIQMKKIDECQTHFKPIPEIEQSLFVPASSNTSLSTISDSRSSRIQRAKEEFLNSPLPTSKPPIFRENSERIRFSVRNRLSQISVGSESSYTSSAYDGLLVKSASAGMINVDPDVYKQFNPEMHDGYVSLPRSKKSKEGLLSNITSKFRKVKMRRHKEKDKEKDKDKMNAVSTLCRQSLVVDIHTDGSQENLSDRLSIPADSRASSSAETSPSTSRSSSWIRRPKIFKSKQ